MYSVYLKLKGKTGNLNKQFAFFIKFFCFLSLVLLVACASSSDNGKKTAKGKLLAKVNEQQLYQVDLAGIVPPNSPKSDSLEIVNRFINNWVRKQLLLAKAKAEVKIDEAEIERKVADYRYALLAFEYEKAYVKNKLDTTVKDEEIQQYYTSFPSDFELKQNIVKSVLVRIPQGSPLKDTLQKQIPFATPKSIALLKEFCVKYSLNCHLNDTLWLDFDNLIQHTPFAKSIVNKVDFLKQSNFSQASDDQFHYLLVIRDYKISNQVSPLPYVRERIKSILVNQRKVKLVRELEQSIFEEASKNNTFKIYQ